MFVRQMEELASQTEAHMTNEPEGANGSNAMDGSATNAAFFNATIIDLSQHEPGKRRRGEPWRAVHELSAPEPREMGDTRRHVGGH
mmetsp:Transcript_50006/g.106374  ORF Transcript_50006/g.106374 Transcript_50006/m.106374 type:complete len:86 (+) Transcript_50006:1068-1325(+)